MGRLVRGHGSRIQFKTYRILAPYDRIISQLAAEIEHGEDHDTHESRRRQEYAKRVLDMFATEVERYKGPEDEFYSKILTPILVRQLKGLHDALSHVVRAMVSQGKPPATTAQAVEFYFNIDPTHPRLIPHYRRQLINLPIARWHLATVYGVCTLGNGDSYDRFHDDHDGIMRSLKENGCGERGPSKIPLLNWEEVTAIVAEGLAPFFKPELDLVVRHLQFLSVNSSSNPFKSPSLLSQSCTTRSSTTSSPPMTPPSKRYLIKIRLHRSQSRCPMSQPSPNHLLLSLTKRHLSPLRTPPTLSLKQLHRHPRASSKRMRPQPRPPRLLALTWSPRSYRHHLPALN